MIKFLLLLVYLTYPLQAGIKKADTTQTIQSTEASKRAYKSNGEVDLDQILDVSVDETIEFKLTDKHIVVGKVKEILFNPAEGVRITGIIPGQSNAGFMFFFSASKTVIGVIFFGDSNIVYQLDYNQTSKMFYFKEQKIEPRDIEDIKIK